MVPSMSRKGDGWNNSPTERSSRSLKSKRLAFFRFETRQSAGLEFLDTAGSYNTDRLYSAIGYISPMEYQKEQLPKAAVA